MWRKVSYLVQKVSEKDALAAGMGSEHRGTLEFRGAQLYDWQAVGDEIDGMQTAIVWCPDDVKLAALAKSGNVETSADALTADEHAMLDVAIAKQPTPAAKT